MLLKLIKDPASPLHLIAHKSKCIRMLNPMGLSNSSFQPQKHPCFLKIVYLCTQHVELEFELSSFVITFMTFEDSYMRLCQFIIFLPLT